MTSKVSPSNPDSPQTFTLRDSNSVILTKGPQICTLNSFSRDLDAQLDSGDCSNPSQTMKPELPS